MDEIITLDYGSGGKKTSRLIESEILSRFSNPALGELGDGAILPGAEKIVFSTDSFVVSPSPTRFWARSAAGTSASWPSAGQ